MSLVRSEGDYRQLVCKAYGSSQNRAGNRIVLTFIKFLFDTRHLFQPALNRSLEKQKLCSKK
jgi:hypothetical protein